MGCEDDGTVELELQGDDARPEAAEVRRRLRSVAQRVAELARERRSLREVQLELAREAREVEARRRALEQARQELEAEVRAQEQEAVALDGELEALRCELPLLRQRCAELGELCVERQAEVGDLEAGLRRFRGEVRASGTALDLLSEAVVRMDHKLGARHLKR